MSRTIFPEDNIHAAIRDKISNYHHDVIDEVKQAIDTNEIVVVGMAQNPHVRRARRLLEAHNKAFKYIEYGSYLSLWHRRLTLKIWTGWPTFPMVFINGTLIGGADDLTRLLEKPAA